MGVRSTGNQHPTTTQADGHLLEYFRQNFGAGGGGTNTAAGQGLTATGGVISDYTDSGTVYRAHIFTSSGTFDVSAIGSFPAEVDYLVVAGGGGGGQDSGTGTAGGGGAGGYRTTMPEGTGGGQSSESKITVSTSPGSYTVTVGGGGVTSAAGSDSVFGPITASGGGTGGAHAGNGGNGGSGGGGGGPGGSAGSASTPTQGYAGGAGSPGPPSGGGGGAGGAGQAGVHPNAPGAGHGGLGLRSTIAGPSSDPSPIGYPGPGSGAAATGWFAGGGGGTYSTGGAGPSGGGPYAGAGDGNDGNPDVHPGQPASGSGGGGTNITGNSGYGGVGGSGIVVVRYKIASTGDAKATGGSVSFYGGKTIHTFTGSGSFVVPASFDETVEYVVVGGGGAGGGPSTPGDSYYGGGGGAGAYRKGTTPISTPQTISIQVGAGGAKGALTPAAGSPSYFGTPITSPGGGFGATWQDGDSANRNGGPGGSSGGANYGGPGTTEPSTGDNFSPTDASANTPTNGWGHPGGTGHPTGDNGGGGGAGGAGQNAADSAAGDGGLGMQLPTTFRDPASTVGAPGPTNTSSHNPGWTNVDDSGKYWVAGGGGGGAYGPDSAHTSGVGGVGSPPVGSSPFAGAGNGSRFFAGGTAALQNTGSGGGGMERAPGAPAPQPDAGNGGSGLVLIAYPT